MTKEQLIESLMKKPNVLAISDNPFKEKQRLSDGLFQYTFEIWHKNDIGGIVKKIGQIIEHKKDAYWVETPPLEPNVVRKVLDVVKDPVVFGRTTQAGIEAVEVLIYKRKGDKITVENKIAVAEDDLKFYDIDK